MTERNEALTTENPLYCDAEEVDKIERWANDPDADCVQIVDFAVPALIATIRRIRGTNPGLRYCLIHDGAANEDDQRCDFAASDEQPAEDGEPRDCDLTPLFYDRAPEVSDNDQS